VKRALLPALILLASCSKAGPADVRISDAWARETVAGQTAAAAYLTLKNEGSGDDRLVGVAAPAPAMAMLHGSDSADGVARMRPLNSGLAVPSGATIELKPGGTHVMITGLGGPLHAGDAFRLTLKLEKSGERPVDVRITSAAGPESH